jgi:hypothetical protein
VLGSSRVFLLCGDGSKGCDSSKTARQHSSHEASATAAVAHPEDARLAWSAQVLDHPQQQAPQRSAGVVGGPTAVGECMYV